MNSRPLLPGVLWRLLVLLIPVLAAVAPLVGCRGMAMGVRPLGTVEGQPMPVRLWPVVQVEPEHTPPADWYAGGAGSAGGHAFVLWPFGQMRWSTDAQGAHSHSWGIHPVVSRHSRPDVTGGTSRLTHTDALWPIFQHQARRDGDGSQRRKLIVFPLALWQTRHTPHADGAVTQRRRFHLFPLVWTGRTRVTTPGQMLDGQPTPSIDDDEAPPTLSLPVLDDASEPADAPDGEPAAPEREPGEPALPTAPENDEHLPKGDSPESDAAQETAPATGNPAPSDSAAPQAMRAERDTGYTLLLPFVWRSEGEPATLPQFNPKGAPYRMYWPFYGHIPAYGPPGSRWEVWFYGWPFYVRSRSVDDPTQQSLSAPWPFFRVMWGGETERATSEVKLWPLFQRKTMANGNHRWYILWPFIIGRDASTADVPDRQFAVFPLYLHSEYKEAEYRIWPIGTGSYRDADESVRFIVWPFYAHWVHEGEQFRETQVLWRVIRWRRSTGDEPNEFRRVLLFYEYHHTPGKERWYHPILFWHGTRTQRFDGRTNQPYTFHGRYHFPVFFQKRAEYEDGQQSLSRFVFPFALHQRDVDGSSLTRGFWPLFEEDWGGLHRNWTPLWEWWRAEHRVLRTADEWRALRHPSRSGLVARLMGEQAPADTESHDDQTATTHAEATSAADTMPAEAPALTPAPAADVRRFTLLGGLYRSEVGPGRVRRHMNLGPFTYDRVNERQGISVLGGFFPLSWDAETD